MRSGGHGSCQGGKGATYNRCNTHLNDAAQATSQSAPSVHVLILRPYRQCGCSSGNLAHAAQLGSGGTIDGPGTDHLSGTQQCGAHSCRSRPTRHRQRNTNRCTFRMRATRASDRPSAGLMAGRTPVRNCDHTSPLPTRSTSHASSNTDMPRLNTSAAGRFEPLTFNNSGAR